MTVWMLFFSMLNLFSIFEQDEELEAYPHARSECNELVQKNSCMRYIKAIFCLPTMSAHFLLCFCLSIYNAELLMQFSIILCLQNFASGVY